MKDLKTRFWLFLLSVIGAVDSLYLTYDHWAYVNDPLGFGGGLCGTDGGCAISRTSSLSEIPFFGDLPGIPLSLIALAFYLVIMVLTARLARIPATEATEPPARNTQRVLFFLSLLALGLSLELLIYSITEGSICKFCVVLYFVNAGLFIVTWRALTEPITKTLTRGYYKAIASRASLVAFVTMLLSTGVLYSIYLATLSPPAPPTLGAAGPAGTLNVAGRPSIGPKDAPLHLIEFADFQCPHCRIAYETLDKVAKKRDDVRVTFIHFPLDHQCNSLIDRPFHLAACELAAYAECAHRQDKFFDIAHHLFGRENTQGLKDIFLTYGIDGDTFDTCLTSPSTKEAIARDVDAGIKLELRGTPAVFLNGVQIGGAVPEDALMDMLDELKAGKAPKAAAP